MSNCPNKQSDSDPIPTWLLKECSPLLVPTITNIVNLSLISGQFHPTLKESIISPLLKKPTLDKEELSNYRPISNLSHFQNNRTCRQIPSHRSPHFQHLLISHESAYCKHHATKTALLYIHDYLINAIGSQKISCLCLLDLCWMTMTSWSPDHLISHSCAIRAFIHTKTSRPQLPTPSIAGREIPRRRNPQGMYKSTTCMALHVTASVSLPNTKPTPSYTVDHK